MLGQEGPLSFIIALSSLVLKHVIISDVCPLFSWAELESVHSLWDWLSSPPPTSPRLQMPCLMPHPRPLFLLIFLRRGLCCCFSFPPPSPPLLPPLLPFKWVLELEFMKFLMLSWQELYQLIHLPHCYCGLCIPLLLLLLPFFWFCEIKSGYIP